MRRRPDRHVRVGGWPPAGASWIPSGIHPRGSGILRHGLSIVISRNNRITETIARQLGITEIHAEILPGDKHRVIQQLQQQGQIVAMAGDGINDAPALAQAQVGIAMGTGTDAAMESANVTLVKGDLRGIAKAYRLSQAVMRNRLNLLLAFGYNAWRCPSRQHSILDGPAQSHDRRRRHEFQFALRGGQRAAVRNFRREWKYGRNISKSRPCLSHRILRKKPFRPDG